MKTLTKKKKSTVRKTRDCGSCGKRINAQMKCCPLCLYDTTPLTIKKSEAEDILQALHEALRFMGQVLNNPHEEKLTKEEMEKIHFHVVSAMDSMNDVVIGFDWEDED